jgi:hypothetical protein
MAQNLDHDLVVFTKKTLSTIDSITNGLSVVLHKVSVIETKVDQVDTKLSQIDTNLDSILETIMTQSFV